MSLNSETVIHRFVYIYYSADNHETVSTRLFIVYLIGEDYACILIQNSRLLIQSIQKRDGKSSPLSVQACHRIGRDWTWPPGRWVWWMIGGGSSSGRRIHSRIRILLARERINSRRLRKGRWRARRCTVRSRRCDGWRVPALRRRGRWLSLLLRLLLLPTPVTTHQNIKLQSLMQNYTIPLTDLFYLIPIQKTWDMKKHEYERIERFSSEKGHFYLKSTGKKHWPGK